jgi:dihydrofolate synthase / folylpolyglutamate synthase
MQIRTLKTHPITPNDSLFEIIDTYIPPMRETEILVITSKIISLCEGRVVAKDLGISKEELIRHSADAYLHIENKFGIQLTIKDNILIPSAGIDESNGNGLYILYPENVQESATKIWQHIRSRDKIKALGVLITDSHTTPMRRGVLGVGLGWCGFKPLYSYIGKPDCFDIPLQVTMVNILDALAVASVFCMGEGNEQTPFSIVSDAPKIVFQQEPPTIEEIDELSIPMTEDLYAPLLKNGSWISKQ